MRPPVRAVAPLKTLGQKDERVVVYVDKVEKVVVGSVLLETVIPETAPSEKTRRVVAVVRAAQLKSATAHNGHRANLYVERPFLVVASVGFVAPDGVAAQPARRCAVGASVADGAAGGVVGAVSAARQLAQ